MEKETVRYHEIVRPLRELGGMVLDLVVPPTAVAMPRPGEVGGVPAQPTLTEVDGGTVA